ncbi:Ribokinase-like protein [Auriculariales sp. MPI-PUGE-AT-0066]|nr:Ribokinase-like protein [Auriculariales sp. MPI-PUGE-AT-0066]
MTTSAKPAPLVCIGDPLIDILFRDAEPLLAKYGLRANDAIRATVDHSALYGETSDFQTTLVAGGAAQSTARGAAYILPLNSVVYSGCVGADAQANFLREANEREGVRTIYNIHPTLPTGACAVLLTGHNRSLVTNVAAAAAFDIAHFSTPDMQEVLAGARIIYTTGFFLANTLESTMYLARQAASRDQVRVCAQHLRTVHPRLHFAKFEAVLPFCDVVLGNEADARSWATAAGLDGDTLSLENIAQAICALPFEASKTLHKRSRTVILTNGSNPTILTTEHETKIIAVPLVPSDEIVDTNGAGDAFAGGLFAGMVLGKPMDVCIALGHRMGAMSVKHVGPQYSFPKVDVLNDL